MGPIFPPKERLLSFSLIVEAIKQHDAPLWIRTRTVPGSIWARPGEAGRPDFGLLTWPSDEPRGAGWRSETRALNGPEVALPYVNIARDRENEKERKPELRVQILHMPTC